MSLGRPHQPSGGIAIAHATVLHTACRWHDQLTPTNNSAASQVGDAARAGPLFERALADLQTALGPDHPDVAHAAIDLGVLRLEQVIPVLPC